MKKAVAMILAVVMMLAFAATAFAETRAYMEWNEEEQMYEIRVYEVEDTRPSPNPNTQYEDYEHAIFPMSGFQDMIDWCDY